MIIYVSLIYEKTSTLSWPFVSSADRQALTTDREQRQSIQQGNLPFIPVLGVFNQVEILTSRVIITLPSKIPVLRLVNQPSPPIINLNALKLLLAIVQWQVVDGKIIILPIVVGRKY